MKFSKNILIVPALLAITACSTTAKGPEMRPSEHPVQAEMIKLESRSALPKQPINPSLWNSGPDSLFGDRRARKAGDIVTVVIEIDEEAEIQNNSNVQRTNDEDFSVTSLFGLNNVASQILPGGSSLSPGVDLARSRSETGSGNISRQEKITLKVAAIVTDILPNGHMIIEGTQMIRVNQEMRDLAVSGIIRTEDISRQNTVTYEKIAEARVSYGGDGQVSDAVAQRRGTRVLDKIIPF